MDRIVPGTDHVVTFAGLPGTNIPAGCAVAERSSPLPVKALDRLAISLYAPGRLPVRNVQALWQYVAGSSGDMHGAPTLPQVRLASAPVILTAGRGRTAPADKRDCRAWRLDHRGHRLDQHAFRGWPDRLAERLAAQPGKHRWAVVNAGIGGNRLLGYGAGPNALARFDRDVLSVPGVQAVIVLEGINDIGRGFGPRAPGEPVTADALIAANKQIIERAHGARHPCDRRDALRALSGAG